MQIINTNNFSEFIKIVRSSQNQKPIIIQAQNEEFNRKAVEYGKFDIILSLEKSAGKNKIRQTDSGLNHVLARISAKNKIAIGISIKEINSLDKKEKAERLVKISQNIKICRKAKAKIAFQKSNENKSLLLTLGASTQQIKEAIPL